MNNQGFSNDNLHIGDVRITEDLTVDGELNINEINVNSLTIGDPEYTLPTSAGTDGQVIVMNPDNTTSDWQDLSTGTARVVVNKFTGTTSRIRNQADNGTIISIQQAGFGSFQYTSDEFSEGSVIVIRAYGNWTYLRSSQAFIPEGKFWLLLGPPPNGPELLELFAPFPEKAFAGTFPSSEGSVGNWELNIQLTRINVTQFRLGGTLTNSLADVQNQVEIPIIFPQKLGNNPDIFTFPGYPFDVAVKWQDNSNQGGGAAYIYPTLCGYTQDLINAGTNVVATSETLTTDHLLLSNINGGVNGDGGHINLFDKRGIKPMTGNINMGNNNIINANEITKTTPSGANFEIKNNDGPLVLSAQGGLSNIQLVTTNNVIANCNLFESTAAVNLFNANIVLFGNQIQQVTAVTSTGTLECNATADLRLVGDTVDMAATNAITHAIGPTTKLTIDGVEITSFTDFNMDNNDLKNVSTINGITPVGGIFAGISDSLVYNPSVDGAIEKSILPTTFVGSLTVPANGFKVGDSFHLVLAGDFNSNNGDTLNIRLYGGPTSTVLLANLPVPLVSSSAVSFEVECDFQLRTIGGPTVANICSNFDFTYNGGAGTNFRGERGVFQNNTTFDTTVNNSLLVTAQYSSTNANNSMKTRVSKLSKTY